MKIKTTLLLLSISALTYSQNIDVSYKDLGLHKKVVKVESMTYSMEDKFVSDNASDLYTFDENGSILLYKFDIYGDYASSTSESSKYQNTKLIQRDVVVENRPNFNAAMTFEYDDDNNLKQRNYQAKYYKNEFFYTYDKDNKLIEVKGVYNSNYSIEKYYYKKDKLYKTIIQHFKNETVSSESIKLYIDNKVVVEYDGSDKFSKAYIKDDSGNMLLQINHTNPIKQIEKMEIEVTKDDITLIKFKEYLLNKVNKPFVKTIVNERYKNNENNDWTAKMGVDIMFKEERKYYTFRKITYADGTESGSIDFNMFTINELKTLFK